MANEKKLHVKFLKENREFSVSFVQPDLSDLVQNIIADHLEVSKDNLHIDAEDSSFDAEEFRMLLVEVHEEFVKEIDQFFTNMQSEISTFYDDEELGIYIKEQIKKRYLSNQKEIE